MRLISPLPCAQRTGEGGKGGEGRGACKTFRHTPAHAPQRDEGTLMLHCPSVCPLLAAIGT
jgi:hypothetical protein